MIFRPGTRSRSSPIQLCGHSARSRQQGNSAQFKYIISRTQSALNASQPVISVDTKKKELVGQYDPGESRFAAMRFTRVLNQCHHFPGFIYGLARFSDDGQSILIPIRPRKRSRATYSGCHRPAAGYDQARKPRHFEFIGVWGFLVFLVYFMRRVDCRQCDVMVEEVP